MNSEIPGKFQGDLEAAAGENRGNKKNNMVLGVAGPDPARSSTARGAAATSWKL